MVLFIIVLAACWSSRIKVQKLQCLRYWFMIWHSFCRFLSRISRQYQGIILQSHSFWCFMICYVEVNLEQIVPLVKYWGRVTHICVGKLTIVGSDNGLSPGRRQAIILTNAGILLIGPLGTNFSEILIATETFSFKTMHSKMSSAKWRLFGLGLNELNIEPTPFWIW